MPTAPPSTSRTRLPSRPTDGRFGRLFREVFTFDRLEVVSLIHSTIYFALLVSAFLLDGPQPYTFIFGLSHGLIWIGMSILSVLAVRYRVINLRLAVAIAVLGCVAPFFGSAEFLRQKHQMKKAAPAVNGPGSLSVINASLDGKEIGLTVSDGRFREIGPGVTPRPGDEVIDAAGAILVPPLVNGHTHAAMTLFRGHGDDLPLMRWLQEAIWPVEAKLEDEDVYWGTRLACVEMIRTGTTRFWDMYWEPAAVARAVEDSGLRATVGPPMIDPNLASDVGSRDRTLAAQLDHLATCGPRITPAVSPHSIYTVGTEGLETAASMAAERDLPLQIHLSETRPEVEDCIAKYGVRPAFYLDSIGLLNEKTVLAHGVWLDRSELELIAERGATVVTNPVANMKLAVGGVFPYPEARRAGTRLGLGTDGPGSNNSLDLMSDLKSFALAQRHASADAEAIPVEEAWATATGRRSDLLGDPDPLQPGKPADFILLDPHALELAMGDLTSNLVYTATGSVVRTTVVDGRILMNGTLPEDAAEIVAKAKERATRLGLT